MSKTKTTVKDVTEWMLAHFGVYCSACNGLIQLGQAIHWDHVHSEGMGGAHGWQNLRPIHVDPCHKAKTKRDVQALAKVDRITGVTGNGPKKKIPSRPFQNGKRKMQSRPWRQKA